MAAVNELRASHGLEPYTIDPWIMDYAQEHSQYQADTQTSTHLHSDGTNSLVVGLRENVAGGDYGYVTISVVVNEIWADWGHLNTMIGYKSGSAGAGVAVGSNNTVYYTLNVRPSGNADTTAGTPGIPVVEPNPTAVFIPIITNTPSQNGNIVHVVAEGRTLWGIAVSYGVTMDEIRSLNNMGSDETTVYVGQRLFIRQILTSATPTQFETTPSMTPTKQNPTVTPTQTPDNPPTFTTTPVADKNPNVPIEGKVYIFGIRIRGKLLWV